MIAWLQGIFDSIQGFFSWLWEAIQWLVDEVLLIFDYVGSALSFIWRMIQLIPEPYIIAGSIILVILVAFVILGRTAGGD